MDNTYIFKENESLDDEFINKLNSGYSVKKISFELYNEVNKNDITNYVSYNRTGDIIYYLNIFHNSVIYYNNIISYYTHPFEKYPLTTKNKIYYINKDNNIINYKMCKILLDFNNNIYFDYIFADNKLIQSNFFNDKEELKKYILLWTDNVDKYAYEEYLDTFSCGLIVLYQTNKDNLKTIYFILHEFLKFKF